MKKPILVVLAAGIGSRYGGIKQMEQFGSHGEVLLDYSVFDALRGGFGKVVFIIRRDLEKDFREAVLARMEGSVEYELAFQELDSLIPPDILAEAKKNGRTKPWGTAHALLCAASAVDAPFAAINADDFYGREAFAAMGGFLAGPDLKDGAIVPYKLEPTLSPVGTVARGVCEVKDGYLVSIDELTAIEKKDGVIFNTASDGARRELEPGTPVSMNFLGYPHSILPKFKQYFDEFIAASGRELKSECYLPKASDWFIKNNYLKMRALHADAEWFGVTYKEDKQAAIERLKALTSQGVYPAPLWG
ncbi:MAG: nucleotidyltransferase family protein [Treponema sp.]|nr:nucleotidyltransferase family protein [Treponema sp.]